MVIIAAVLLSLAFNPVGFWPLAILSYALLIRELESSRRPVIASWIFGFASSLLILKWSDIYVGVVPYIALSLVQSLFSIPLGVHLKYFKNIAFLPLTFLIAEYLREVVPFGGFSWTQVGFSQIDSPYASLASLGGVFLLSLLVFSLGCARNRYQIALVVLLVLSSLITRNPSGTGERVTVAAIQGTTPPRSNDYNADIKEVFLRHYGLSKEVKRVDLIVWPEDVVDGKPTDKEFSQYFAALKGQNLVIGNSPFVDKSPENLSTFIDRSGEIRSIYNKRSLVPFGEYVPFRSLVRKLNSHVDEVIDYRPGDRTVVHDVDGNTFSSLICFEIVDTHVVKSAAQKSTFILAQTNTSTFLGTYESAQQFDITRMRAIEYSRPILSVSTVGYTAFIDNNGRVEKSAPLNRPTILTSSMVGNSYQTMYARFPFLSLIFALFFGLVSRRKR